MTQTTLERLRAEMHKSDGWTGEECICSTCRVGRWAIRLAEAAAETANDLNVYAISPGGQDALAERLRAALDAPLEEE
jgi:hypothetical protein